MPKLQLFHKANNIESTDNSTQDFEDWPIAAAGRSSSATMNDEMSSTNQDISTTTTNSSANYQKATTGHFANIEEFGDIKKLSNSDAHVIAINVYQTLLRSSFRSKIRYIIDRPLIGHYKYETAQLAIEDFQNKFRVAKNFEEVEKVLDFFFSPSNQTSREHILLGNLRRENKDEKEPEQPISSKLMPIQSIIEDLQTMQCATIHKPDFKELTDSESQNFLVDTASYILKDDEERSPIFDREFDWNRALTRTIDPVISLPFPFLCKSDYHHYASYMSTYTSVVTFLSLNRHESALELLKNLFYLIDNYHFVPQGNREYYLDRSELPVLAVSVKALSKYYLQHHLEKEREYLAMQALPRLLKDYFGFWMNPQTKRVVPIEGEKCQINPKLPILTKLLYNPNKGNECLVNRYYAGATGPRYEALSFDSAFFKEASHYIEALDAEKKNTFYRMLRTGSESNFPDSLRWSINNEPNTRHEGGLVPLKEYINDNKILDIAPIELNILLKEYGDIIRDLIEEYYINRVTNVPTQENIVKFADIIKTFNDKRDYVIKNIMNGQDLYIPTGKPPNNRSHSGLFLYERAYNLPRKTERLETDNFLNNTAIRINMKYGNSRVKEDISPFFHLFLFPNDMSFSTQEIDTGSTMAWDIEPLYSVLEVITKNYIKCRQEKRTMCIPENYNLDELKRRNGYMSKPNSLLTITSALSVALTVKDMENYLKS